MGGLHSIELFGKVLLTQKVLTEIRIVPVIGTGTMAIGIVMAWLACSAYIIDAFGIYAASAVAANTFIRSVMAAFIPLAGPPLFAALGLGWGNTRKFVMFKSL